MCGRGRLSRLEAIQRMARVTASTTIVKLEVEVALSWWIVLAPCLTVKSHPDWSVVNFTDTVVWQLANHGGLNRIWFPLNNVIG